MSKKMETDLVTLSKKEFNETLAELDGVVKELKKARPVIALLLENIRFSNIKSASIRGQLVLVVEQGNTSGNTSTVN